MAPLRVGIIGLGVGEEHIAGYRRADGCEVVAICDLSAQRRAEVAERHPDLPVTEDADALLDDQSIDVVSIASYDDFHASQVKRALRNGKHVFVEKPLCLEETDAREIHLLLGERRELRLSCNLPLRASPRFREARRLLRDGELGRLYYIEGDYDYGRLWKLTEGWRGDLERYSVFLGGGVHIVDLIGWMTDERVVRVSASGNRVATEGTKFRFEDLVVALLELESGVVAKVSANFACVHPHFHGFKLFGTEATFINGLGDATVWRQGRDGPERSSVDAPYPGVGKGDLIPSFIDSIVGRGPAAVCADEVFRTMATCFAVERALVSGQPSEVEEFG
jgi:predicted dehydrogenase